MPWVIAGAAVLIVALIFGPRLLEKVEEVEAKKKVSQTKDKCASIQLQIESLPQGSDPATRAMLEAQLRACRGELESLGETVDNVSSILGTCASNRNQMRQEWSHYKSTSYSDVVKRNNTRQSILRMGEQGLACLQGALEVASSKAELQRVEREARAYLADSILRGNEFKNGAAGTGRFGFNEDDNPVKARHEDERVTSPLRQFLGLVEERLRSAE